MKKSIYEPREDSLLLSDQVRKNAKGVVLDMGTGSGIQAEAALELRQVERVIAVDKNPAAVKHCKRTIKKRKLECYVSDLFAVFKKGKLKGTQFDTIIFNPPYLPADKNKPDMALIGGKKGYEVVERFLADAPHHLKTGGSILLLFSNLTNRHKVEELIKLNGFEFKQLASSRQFFEELFIYQLAKNETAQKLEPMGFSDIHYLDEGQRGVIFTAMHNGRKVAIKIKKPTSEAEGRVRNEGRTLELVNKHGLGPKLLMAKPDLVVYEFVEGVFLKDWLPKARKAQIKPLLRDLLHQGFVLDKLGVAKEEMHRPLKNAIVAKNKVVLIDWERTHQSKKAHNVTQLCQFLMVWRDVLTKKGMRIKDKDVIEAAKAYKQKPSDTTFNAVVKTIDKS
ncbi:methyltransferase [Candidatus Woesearchaeota archaeon]|nr:methyltransferase [Candidatus Woesearchaeota archaeon]